LGLFDVLVRLDESEIRRLAKVLLEALGGDCLAWTMDEVECGGPIFGELLDKRCFAVLA
jgi:heterodisulfide reductase subunit B